MSTETKNPLGPMYTEGDKVFVTTLHGEKEEDIKLEKGKVVFIKYPKNSLTWEDVKGDILESIQKVGCTEIIFTPSEGLIGLTINQEVEWENLRGVVEKIEART